MRLGMLIARLKVINENYDEEAWSAPARVSFNFCHLVPDGVDSWRGIYAELAIGWSDTKDHPKLEDFILELEGCIGRTFTGWKGGEFTMDEDTPVHIDKPGRFTDTHIEGVAAMWPGAVIIATQDGG